MNSVKSDILNNICYTELVYGRINKKLNRKLSCSEIEELLFTVISRTQEEGFHRIGKNYYVTNRDSNIRITINSNTYRVITVDPI